LEGGYLAKFVSEDRIVELFKKLDFGGLDARVYITLLSGAPTYDIRLAGRARGL